MSVSLRGAAHLERELGDESAQMLFDPANVGSVKKFLAALARKENRKLLPVAMDDKDLPDSIRAFAELRRKFSVDVCQYRGAIHWSMRQGFTVKGTAPNAGPCVGDFQYLKDLNFNDTPTAEGIAFWVPRLVPGSTNKSVTDQKSFLAELRERYQLPATDLAGFGSVAKNAALILAHFRRTGERVPLDGLVIRTDSLSADGSRLDLYWDGDALRCDCWPWRDDAHGNVGSFALGVETLGQ